MPLVAQSLKHKIPDDILALWETVFQAQIKTQNVEVVAYNFSRPEKMGKNCSISPSSIRNEELLYQAFSTPKSKKNCFTRPTLNLQTTFHTIM